ncbi:PREDICTED: uncharacterized protein LOC105558452 [Vollenhovia emeryi]|uniref:uncharacterized protein LOC105558452 n=1 Tax=Vollenhovia emeryi TaxID=411798 RepID=UPI0005F39259|nr:PREDICTED: uncharacterized protein LOC105558452 [Vollenhovia emeryi]
MTPAFSTTALILKNLTAYAPLRVPRDPALNHLTDLAWADDDPTSSHAIDVLIGADLYGELLLNGVRNSPAGRPIAQNSVLGWIISGPIASPIAARASTVTSYHVSSRQTIDSLQGASEPSLEQALHQFWEVEEVPRNILLTPSEEKCKAHFRLTHSRDSDGRYIVRLPFRNAPPIAIGESRAIAERVMNRLTTRLHSKSELRDEYRTFLHDYESLGHMREVPRSLDHTKCVYIPHLPVIRKGSATTRLRVVFNASSLISNGSSLNDHLLAGPKLQNDLSSVILQWRTFQYIYAADIAKIYVCCLGRSTSDRHKADF